MSKMLDKIISLGHEKHHFLVAHRPGKHTALKHTTVLLLTLKVPPTPDPASEKAKEKAAKKKNRPEWNYEPEHTMKSTGEMFKKEKPDWLTYYEADFLQECGPPKKDQQIVMEEEIATVNRLYGF